MATPIAHKGIQYGAKVVALTAIDFLLNEQKMAKYRPEMRRIMTILRSTRAISSYLEQLGIKYPTVRSTQRAQPH